MWRKGNPSALLVGMQTGAATVKTVSNFLRKLKLELPHDTVIPLLGIYHNNPETQIRKNVCIPMFIAASFTTAKISKQSKCPSLDELGKKAAVHLHNGILFGCKKIK